MADGPVDPRNDLEGLRLMQAQCERCGYQFGGQAVHDNALLCPECAHTTRIEFKDLTRAKARLKRLQLLRSVARWLAFLGLLGAVGMILAELFKP